jgi:hypothetical protein
VRIISRSSSRAIVLTLAVMFLATASFAMVREVSFEELTELSETTMEVVVVNSYAAWNAEHTAIFTHYVVEPIRQVGGANRGPRFELLFAGGRTSDGKQMIVTEVPQMEIGGQYILFLHPRQTRHASPTVGMWQGALRVVHDPELKRSVVVDAMGRLIEKDSEGKLHRGRNVNVDASGFMTAAVVEPEPGMDVEPVLTDPQGRVIPMPRAPRVVANAVAESRVPVDPDMLMKTVERIRENLPRVRQSE